MDAVATIVTWVLARKAEIDAVIAVMSNPNMTSRSERWRLLVLVTYSRSRRALGI